MMIEITPTQRRLAEESKARKARMSGPYEWKDEKARLLMRIENMERDKRIIEGELARRKTQLKSAQREIASMNDVIADLEARCAGYERVLKEEDLRCIGSRRTAREIISATLEGFHNITMADVLGVRRDKIVVAARTACVAAVSNERPDLSYSQLGRIFNRHHTTILNTLRKAGVWRPQRMQGC